MSYILEHTTLGFCWWDLPALIILIVVIVAFAWKHHDMKKQEKDLEDQISTRIGIPEKAYSLRYKA